MSKRVIFWDFDGVIMDSMAVRDRGFEIVLENYPEEQVDELMAYHRANGGLSRYVKFRYFFEQIRRETITDSEVNDFANQFSIIMLGQLKNPDLLIIDSMDFIKGMYNAYDMHVVSGSDGRELNEICTALNIAQYFQSINGSPANKVEILNRLMSAHGYKASECVFVGDSKNDWQAADAYNMTFAGYNNLSLKPLSDVYINQFTTFDQSW